MPTSASPGPAAMGVEILRTREFAAAVEAKRSGVRGASRIQHWVKPLRER